MGSNTLTLTGSNRYGGGTTIAGGTLSIANDYNIGSGSLTLTGSGALELYGSTAFTSSRNIEIVQTGIIQQDASAPATCSGAIGGPGELLKSGNGDLILSGSNSFTGGIVVTTGELVLTHGYAIPDGARLTVGSGAALVFDPSAIYSGPSLTVSQPAAPVPEPGTGVLLLVGFIAITTRCYRRRGEDARRFRS